MQVSMPVPAAELIDRITIFAIKRDKKRAGAGRDAEHVAALEAARAAIPRLGEADVREIEAALLAVNLALWDLEDEVRALAAAGDFGPAFVTAARAIATTNDERARLKSRINALVGSALGDDKWFASEGDA